MKSSVVLGFMASIPAAGATFTPENRSQWLVLLTVNTFTIPLVYSKIVDKKVIANSSHNKWMLVQ